MKFKQFVESFQTDRIKRQAAIDFFDKLQKWVKKNMKNMDKKAHRLDDFGGWAIDAGLVDPVHQGMAIILASPESEYAKRSPMGMKVLASFGHFKNNFPAIFLFSLNGDFDVEHADTRLSGAKTNFVHEFIHYLDSLRMKSNQKSAQKLLKSVAAYYNSPEEFNAFYQEGVFEIYRLLGSNSMVPINKQKELLGKSFEEFFSKISSFGFDEDFVESLDNKYMRKLKKRLSDVYADIRDWLQEQE